MRTSSEQRIEDAIDEARDDAELYLVYADVLAQRGDPRAELIVRQCRGVACDDYLAEHEAVLLGPARLHARRVEWRNGFVRRLELEWYTSFADDPDEYLPQIEAPIDEAELAAIIEHPALRYLDELVLGPVSAMTARHLLLAPATRGLRALALHVIDWTMMDAVVDAIAAHQRPHLRTLAIEHAWFEKLSEHASSADVISEIEHDHGPFVSNDLVPALAAATPALDELRLVGGHMFGDFAHPNVTRMDLVGHPIDALSWHGGTSLLPKLRVLEMTAVDDEYRHAPIGDFYEPMLDPRRLPALRHLRFDGNYDEGHNNTSLFRLLAELPILAQLETLRLPYLYEAYDAEYLEAYAPRFRHLRSFVVDEIDAELAARCRTLGYSE